ncbi:MAG: OmpA family protein [Desulfovibrio sp.]|uniref:OmpA family protein n=1 Tax=Desulfovibrio sp. 7SRBS1 TaxID=3378064 RepID=UPI003B3D7960
MKRLMLPLVAVAMLCMVATAYAQSYQKKADNFVILFDSSGSMSKEYYDTGKKKAVIAKEILEAMNQHIPDLGYRCALYGFTPWKQFYGPEQYDRDQFAQAINALPIDPNIVFGYPTPMGKAMVELGPVLDQLEGRTLVYLFSDGLNTDDLNVIKKAETLTKKHDVCFIIVSMATTDEGQATLNAIRDLTECSHIIGFDEAVRSPELFLSSMYEETAPEVVIVQKKVVKLLPPPPAVETIWFGLDSTKLDAYSRSVCDKFAADLINNPESKLGIAGFASSEASDEYNINLSKKRAETVRDYFVQNGISADRIELKWFGEKSPAVSNETKAGRRLNRRVEMVVIP